MLTAHKRACFYLNSSLFFCLLWRCTRLSLLSFLSYFLNTHFFLTSDALSVSLSPSSSECDDFNIVMLCSQCLVSLFLVLCVRFCQMCLHVFKSRANYFQRLTPDWTHKRIDAEQIARLASRTPQMPFPNYFLFDTEKLFRDLPFTRQPLLKSRSY